MTAKLIAQGVCAMVYAVEVAVLLWISESKYSKKYYIKAKMMCSISFVLIAGIFAGVSGHWAYFLQLFPTLLFCALGDLFMGYYRVRRYTRNIILGICCFLVAHICLLILLFGVIPDVSWWLVVIPIVAVMLLCIQKKMLNMHYGRLWIPVLIYSVFLSLDLAKSVEVMLFRPCISSAWIGVGGILFFISDYTLNFCYFCKLKTKRKASWMNLINLASYFFGILAFDMSILYFIK